MDKHVYVLIKSLKYFRVLILHSHVISYIPDDAIKIILVQPDSDGRRGKWIAKMLEFDLEIKPTKLIKGQGLSRLMNEMNIDTFDVNSIMEKLKFLEDESVVKVDDHF